MLDTDFSSAARLVTCLRIPFGCLWGATSHGALDAGGLALVEDAVSLARVTRAVHTEEDEGGGGKGRGAGGRGRGGRDGGGGGREEGGGPEMGNVRRRGGGERGRGRAVKAAGGGGGCAREEGMLGGWGTNSKEFLSVSLSKAQLGVSLFEPREFTPPGLGGGESSRVQSAGEVTTLGSDRSSTALEMVGRVENEK